MAMVPRLAADASSEQIAHLPLDTIIPKGTVVNCGCDAFTLNVDKTLFDLSQIVRLSRILTLTLPK